MRLRNKIVAGALVATGAIAFAVHQSRALPNGPQALAWDRESCLECHMLISDKRFAAQLQTANGAIRNFDDPGCLMLYVTRTHPEVRAIYFRDSQSGNWLLATDAGFVPSASTPMGHGLAAVRKNSAGAIPYQQAMKEVH
jgi:hypothetical protein